MLRSGLFAFAVALVAASVVFAADTMAPSDIQVTFFTGQAFTARTPSGAKFKMTFTPDGKMTREPLPSVTKGIAPKSMERGNASTGTGTWRLNAKGFCTTWAHSKPTCFTVVPSGDNKWSVQKSRPPLQLQFPCGRSKRLVKCGGIVHGAPWMLLTARYKICSSTLRRHTALPPLVAGFLF